MQTKQQCWEFMNCGLGPGGARTASEGICPAAVDMTRQGQNHGFASGRQCWAVTGTKCGHEPRQKFSLCLRCPFFWQVEKEEERSFSLGLRQEVPPQGNPNN